MKIVIIGVIGHIHYALDGIRKNPETMKICGIASATPEDMPETTSQNLIQEFGVKFYTDWQYMLDITKPDVAIIATRFDMNGVISLECLKRGINCFTEKSIAHSLELLDEIKQTAINNNVKIIGMHGMRYNPEFFTAYKAVQTGAIGDIVMLYGRKSYCFGSSRPDFYRHRNTYGGTVLWVAVHALDWFCWLAGDILEIYAAHTVKGNKGYGECEAATVISTRFDKGAIGTISADFLRPEKAGSHADDQLRIAGEKGIIEVRNGKTILTDNKNQPQELEMYPNGDFFGDFCRSLQGKGQCRLTMEDTFQVTRAALLARDSADFHKLVTVL
jgi:predicted dehydrogenase